MITERIGKEQIDNCLPLQAAVTLFPVRNCSKTAPGPRAPAGPDSCAATNAVASSQALAPWRSPPRDRFKAGNCVGSLRKKTLESCQGKVADKPELFVNRLPQRRGIEPNRGDAALVEILDDMPHEGRPDATAALVAINKNEINPGD